MSDEISETRNVLRAELEITPSDTFIFESFAPSSQYDRLLALNPMPKGRLIAIALDGCGFHGQFGRSWQTARGNLFMCTKFDLDNEPDPVVLQSLGPNAVIEAIAPFSAVPPTLKPINDVMLGGAKIAGTLTHYRASNFGRCVFFGIGVNLVSAPPCDQPVTCLCEHLRSGMAPKTLSCGLSSLYLDVAKRLWISLSCQITALNAIE